MPFFSFNVFRLLSAPAAIKPWKLLSDEVAPSAGRTSFEFPRRLKQSSALSSAMFLTHYLLLMRLEEESEDWRLHLQRSLKSNIFRCRRAQKVTSSWKDYWSFFGVMMQKQVQSSDEVIYYHEPFLKSSSAWSKGEFHTCDLSLWHDRAVKDERAGWTLEMRRRI